MKKFISSPVLSFILCFFILVLLFFNLEVFQEFRSFVLDYQAIPADFNVYHDLKRKNLTSRVKRMLFTPSYEKTKNGLFIEIEKEKLKELDSSLPKSGFEKKPIKLFYKGKKYKASLRYKGDNFYHWIFPKKSLKIELDDGEKIFNHFQLPLVNIKGESLMNEFIGNWVAKKFDLLTRNEFFIPVFINNKYQGVYLYTEPIEKELFEMNKKPYTGTFVGENIGKDRNTSFQTSALFNNVFAWKQKNISNKKILNKFLEKLNKISFVNGDKDYLLFREMVNIPYFIRFLAWTDLVQTFHFDDSHNIVLYKDSTSGTFFQIPVDSFSWFHGWFSEEGHLDITKNLFYTNLLRDPRLIQKKYEFIHKNLNEELIKEIIQKIDDEYKKNEELIAKDFFKARFGRRIPLSTIEYLTALDNFKKRVKDSFIVSQKITKTDVKYVKMPKKLDVYVGGRSAVVLKYCVNKSDVLYPGREMYRKGDIEKLNPAFLKYSFSFSPDCLFEFKNALTGELVEAEEMSTFDESQLSDYSFHPWNLEKAEKEIQTERILEIKNKNPWIKTEGETLYFEGTHEVTENIIVPDGVTTVIMPGTNLLLNKGISFVSYGKVLAEGTPNAPIVVKAKNPEKPFGTFALANEGASGSHFNYFQIEHGSETTINGIYFSGMFSAYHNDDVVVENSKFSHSHSDDGLNFKYSNSKVLNSEFYQNSADAIDFDFMAGEVRGNKFIENGNDSIDTSGSTTLILDNYIYKSGDKCMSFGENTKTIAINNILDSCSIGVECKDLTTSVLINNVIINNKMAVNSYQKKEFFGPAHCEFYNTVFSNNEIGITFQNNFKEDGKKFETDTSETTVKNSVLPYKEFAGNDNQIEKVDFEALKQNNFAVSTEGNIEKLKEFLPVFKDDSVNIGIFDRTKIPQIK